MMRHILDDVHGILVSASNALNSIDPPSNRKEFAFRLLDEIYSAIDKALRLVQAAIDRDRHEMEDEAR